jgi:aspartyl-tRNA(Asn)/glutamyl-tRNA(Gln) amidotransferase subunit A
VAPYTCTVLEKVLESGAILIGVNKMDEFAMGASGETTQFGITKNPFDLERVPGGSSSGGAACVGAGQVVFSLGTDTGGSIRQPAAFCGAMGLKPTYGLVSRFGVIPMSSSLDQVGAITQNIQDNILLTSIMAGQDSKDQTSIDSTQLVTNLQNLLANPSVKKYKIGIPKEFYENLDPIIAQKLEDLKLELAKMGHTLIPVSLPLSKYSVAVYYTLMAVEVASNLERYDGIRYSKQNSKKLLNKIFTKITTSL